MLVWARTSTVSALSPGPSAAPRSLCTLPRPVVTSSQAAVDARMPTSRSPAAA